MYKLKKPLTREIKEGWQLVDKCNELFSLSITSSAYCSLKSFHTRHWHSLKYRFRFPRFARIHLHPPLTVHTDKQAEVRFSISFPILSPILSLSLSLSDDKMSVMFYSVSSTSLSGAGAQSRSPCRRKHRRDSFIFAQERKKEREKKGQDEMQVVGWYAALILLVLEQ